MMSTPWVSPAPEPEAKGLFRVGNLQVAAASIALPGVGHIMRYRYTIGIAWTIFSLAFYGALILFRVAADADLYLLTGIAAILLSWAAVYDCCLRRSLQSATRKLFFFAVVVLASLVWANAVCYWCSLAAGFRYMQNVSQSMMPTIARGARLLVDWHYYQQHKPQDGDLVVVYHQYANSAIGVYTFKRLIGVSGDTVQISDGKLIRNGVLVEEQYASHQGSAFELWQTNMPARTVPPSELFLLGDNRNLSLDSRAPQVGNYKESELRGKVLRLARYW